MRLRGIVDDGQIGGGGLRRPAVEVNDDHRLRALRSVCFPCRRGHGGSARIDVDEDGRGADRAHCRGGGHGRERRDEDLVARADTECVEDELEPGRPGGHADHMGIATPCRQLALEALELRAEENVTGGEHPRHDVLERSRQCRGAPAQVDDRYHGWRR